MGLEALLKEKLLSENAFVVQLFFEGYTPSISGEESAFQVYEGLN